MTLPPAELIQNEEHMMVDYGAFEKVWAVMADDLQQIVAEAMARFDALPPEAKAEMWRKWWL